MNLFSMLTYLKESANQPRKFWLVTDTSNIDQLSTGKLEGLKGVSGSKEIVIQFFTVGRDTIIVMNPDAVLRVNNLEKINYHDADHLLANDMDLLYRIFNKPKTAGYGRYGVMQNLMDYIVKFAYNMNVGYDLSRHRNKFADIYEKSGIAINSKSDFVSFLSDTYHKIARSPADRSEFEVVINQTLEKIAQVYSDEDEWIVHSDTFNIPEQSQMIISVDSKLIELWKKWKQGELTGFDNFRYQNYVEKFDKLYTEIQEKLVPRYKVKFVDSRKYQEIRSKLFVKRGKG